MEENRLHYCLRGIQQYLAAPAGSHTDRSGNVIGRSKTYTDVVLSSCAAFRHILQIRVITTTPTATFFFVK